MESYREGLLACKFFTHLKKTIPVYVQMSYTKAGGVNSLK